MTKLLMPEIQPSEQPKKPVIERQGQVQVAGYNLQMEAAIAQGGFGKLFKARDLRNNQEVALKIIDLSRAPDPQKATEIVLKEARVLTALKTLKHRALPEFLGAEIDDKNYEALILMEYLEGKALNEVMSQQPFSEEEVMKVITEVGSALAQLHRPPAITRHRASLTGNALIQGDLKPENIIATNNPDRPYVLIDYGIASDVLHARQPKQPQALKAQKTYGTPPYVDPHFFFTSRLLPASDVYSFAATILDLTLSGGLDRHLGSTFQDRMKPLDVSQGAILAGLVEKTKLSPRLQAILRRSLSLNVEERPQDMREFLRELSYCEGPFYQVHADGFVEFDLEWLDLFPKEIQQAIEDFTIVLENQALTWDGDEFYDPSITIRGKDGKVAPIISREALQDWHERVEAIRTSRQKLVDFWQANKGTQQARFMAEFLTFIEYRTNSAVRKERMYTGHASIKDEEYQQFGWNKPQNSSSLITVSSPYREVQYSQDIEVTGNVDLSKQVTLSLRQAKWDSIGVVNIYRPKIIYNSDGTISLEKKSWWELYGRYQSAKQQNLTQSLRVLEKVLESEVTSPEKAQEIMGEKQFFGAEVIEQTFSIKLAAKDIPPVPFTAQELEAAQKDGMFLMLQIDKAQDGKALTIYRMIDLIRKSPRFRQEKIKFFIKPKAQDITPHESVTKKWILGYQGQLSQQPVKATEGFLTNLSTLRREFYRAKIKDLANPYAPKGQEVDLWYSTAAESVYQLLMLHATDYLGTGITISGRTSSKIGNTKECLTIKRESNHGVYSVDESDNFYIDTVNEYYANPFAPVAVVKGLI